MMTSAWWYRHGLVIYNYNYLANASIFVALDAFCMSFYNTGL